MSELAPIVPIDQAAVLRALRLDPADPNAQAALLICDRYDLDPVMKHVVLIQGRPYITRDGLLTIAHRSGTFDGIEVVAEGEDDTHWTATVAVWRKDMSHPFRYSGRHPKKSGNQYGREMAVKCAEVMALRRAFSVTGVGTAEEQWDTADPPPPVQARAEIAADHIGPAGAHDLNQWLRDVIGTDDRLRDRLRRWWADNDLPIDADSGRPDIVAITPAQRDVVCETVTSWLPDSAADRTGEEATVGEAAVASDPPWETDEETGQ